MLLRLILKRYLHRWKFLTVVFAGMLLSSTTMSGSIMYFDSLRDIALDFELSKISSEKLDVNISSSEKPLMGEKYIMHKDDIEGTLTNPLNKYSNQNFYGTKTSTFLPIEWGKTGEEMEKGATSRLTSLCNSSQQISENRAIDICKRYYFSFFEDADKEELINFEKATSNSDENSIGIYIDKDIAKLFNISTGEKLELEAYWDESNPIVNIFVLGFFSLSKNESFNNFYLNNFLQEDSSFIFANLVIKDINELSKLGNKFLSMDSDLIWMTDIDEEKINSTEVSKINSIIVDSPPLLSSKYDNFSFKTGMVESLEKFDSNLSTAAIPMKTILILISVVIIFFVFSLVSLIVEDQKEEITFLSSRGASLRQIYIIFNLEFLVMAIIVSLLGPYVAFFTIKASSFLPWLSEMLNDSNVYVGITSTSFLFSGLGGLVSLSAVVIPTFFFLRSKLKISSVDEREEPNFIQKYYLDMWFLLLALLLMWQISQSQSVFVQNLIGESIIANIILLMPSFILLGAGIVLLRIFPLLIRGLSIFLSLRYISNFIPSWIVLSLWHIGRSSNTYSRMSLLIILAAALGMFTSSFKATLDRSIEDTVSYRVGSEFRIDGLQIPWNGDSKNINSLQFNDNVIQAHRSSERVKASILGPSFSLLSIDSSKLTDDSIFWRDDFTESVSSISSKINPVEYEPVKLHEEADLVGIQLRLILEPSRVSNYHGAGGSPHLIIAAKLSDANSRFYTAYFNATDCALEMMANIEFFRSNDDYWCDVITPVKPELLNPYIRTGRWFGITKKDDPRNAPFIPEYPVSLHSIFITSPSKALEPGAIDFHKISSIKGTVEMGIPKPEKTLSEYYFNDEWNVLNTSSQSLSDNLIFTKDTKEFLRFQWTNGDTRQLRGFSKYDSDKPIEVIVSDSFLENIDAKIGDVVTVTIMASEFSIKIIDTINYFPTLYPDTEPFVIAELADVINGANIRKKQGDNQANEIWVINQNNITDKNLILNNVVGELKNKEIPYGSIFSNEKSLEGQKIDPLVFAGWQTLLLISFGAVTLVSVVGFLIHSRVSFKKRNLEFATLKSIGISRKQIIILIAIEQVLVIGLALLLGIILGSRLSSTVMPYLISPESSNSLVPPMINSVEWFDFSIVFGSVGLLFLVIIIYTILSVFKISINDTMRINLK
ncbi:MAG: FtsX-like permease family protein [Chloroflexota bacterium]|nr:FtsX-like permease family protein [Chloroflexota bacterium]